MTCETREWAIACPTSEVQTAIDFIKWFSIDLSGPAPSAGSSEQTKIAMAPPNARPVRQEALWTGQGVAVYLDAPHDGAGPFRSRSTVIASWDQVGCLAPGLEVTLRTTGSLTIAALPRAEPFRFAEVSPSIAR